MSMLADRRDKNRYTLVPRGKALYEDKNSFGARMLEKMGWSKGKGLGAKEDGNKEFIRVKCKNDSKGFGFEDRDDQWTQHEEDFNGLLKSLSGNNSENDIADNEGEYKQEGTSQRTGFGFEANNSIKNGKLKVNLSGESLEEKSKKSRARVHYKKFIRGKDLTQYSEKDLANIFGKKTMNNDENNRNKTEVNVDENEREDLQYGVLVKKADKSLENYFSEKMKKLKLKKNENSIETTINNIEKNCESNVHKNKSKKLNKLENKESARNQENLNGMENVVHENEEIFKTKKKKKSKNHLVEKDDGHSKEQEQLSKKLESPTAQIELKRKSDNDIHKKSCKKMKNKINMDADETKQISNEFTNQLDETKNSNKEIESKQEKKELQNNSEMSTENQIEVINDQKLKAQECSPKTEHEIKDEFELSNSYYTSAFILEKFRCVALDKFKGSNIHDIAGYGFNDELEIKVSQKAIDTKRLLDMWVDIENNKLKYEIKEKFKQNKKKGIHKKKRRKQKLFTKI